MENSRNKQLKGFNLLVILNDNVSCSVLTQARIISVAGIRIHLPYQTDC